MQRMNRKRSLLIFGALLFFALAATCIDVYYEWPQSVPGDPPSALYTYRESIGVNHGWLFYCTDDIFAYDDLQAGFKVAVHAPIFREPYGLGGWMDFTIAGIAPWFVGILLMILYLIWHPLWGLIQKERAAEKRIKRQK